MPAVRFRTRTLGQRELPRGQDFRWIRGDIHEPRTDAIGRSGQLHAGRRRGLRHQVLEDRGHRTPPANVERNKAVRVNGVAAGSMMISIIGRRYNRFSLYFTRISYRHYRRTRRRYFSRTQGVRGGFARIGSFFGNGGTRGESPLIWAYRSHRGRNLRRFPRG